MNIDDLSRGLLSSPPFIPTWFRYDETGSILNDQCINENPYYYFHREEKQLLMLNIKELMGHLGENVSVVDLGSGNAEKTRIVLNALLERQETVHYVPVDISGGMYLRDIHSFVKQNLLQEFLYVYRLCRCR
ncbi:hypothetical protein FSP39_011037 [Pinctada imbricata]|uniref:Histidine-specific methyltransferase SAM-dependent domain-containing protein n=1 Tax=Pinctada imbricata TaxID=66713 RepID=A0AA88YCW5_PINIB|nr:hypothetical protein FSP39_011037 [Pinctada imbricata]